jgi:hypothetical protein
MDTLASKEVVDHILAHHGVLGMKWGVRRGESSTSSGSSSGRLGKKTTPVTVKTGSSPRGHATIKTHGGHHVPAHPDAIAAKKVEQQLKRSGHHSLSNTQLQTYANRKELEQRVNRVAPPTDRQRVMRGARQVTQFLRTPEGRATVGAAKKVAKSKRVRGYVTKRLATAATVAALA